MEKVFAVYHQPYDARFPLVCMDESPCQLIGEIRQPFTDHHGVEHIDYEYARKGTVSIFAALEPLVGKRLIRVRDRHAAKDWVEFMQELAGKYPQADRITLVLDNFATHKDGSFYEFMSPMAARTLTEKFEYAHTPKHGSWLNIAEIALNVLKKQCLNRRMPDKQTMQEQIEAWLKDQQNKKKPIDWQFDITDARAKLKQLYPKF